MVWKNMLSKDSSRLLCVNAPRHLKDKSTGSREPPYGSPGSLQTREFHDLAPFQVPEFSRILDLRCWSIAVVLKLTGQSLKASLYHRRFFFTLLFYVAGENQSWQCQRTPCFSTRGCVCCVYWCWGGCWACKESCRIQAVAGPLSTEKHWASISIGCCL